MAYGGEDDRRAFALGVNWFFTSVSLFVVALRFASRHLLERIHVELDDGMIVVAMLVILARTVWLTVNVSMGFGRHLLALLKEDPVMTAKLSPSSYGLTAISLWTFVLPKAAVVALLVRLFTTYSRRLGRTLWSMLALLFVWNLIMTVVAFVKCDPVRKNWAPKTPGKCWNPHVYLHMGYFSGAYSAFLDFSYAIYPMVKVSQLQMEKSRKTLIVLSFSLGIPAGIVSIVKITTIKSLTDAGDPTFATIPLEVWNAVESCALMIAATIPLTQPVMKVAFTRMKSLTSYISSVTSRSSRGTSKASKSDLTLSGSGNLASPHQGWQRQDSTQNIFLENARQEKIMFKR